MLSARNELMSERARLRKELEEIEAADPVDFASHVKAQQLKKRPRNVRSPSPAETSSARTSSLAAPRRSTALRSSRSAPSMPIASSSSVTIDEPTSSQPPLKKKAKQGSASVVEVKKEKRNK